MTIRPSFSPLSPDPIHQSHLHLWQTTSCSFLFLSNPVSNRSESALPSASHTIPSLCLSCQLLHAFLENLTVTPAKEADQCFAQSSSDKLPPAADTNKYRDPPPDNTQRLTDIGMFITKGMTPSNTSPQDSGCATEEYMEQKGCTTHKKQDHINIA